MKVNRRLMLTFPAELSTEPVIFTVGQQFGVVTNICRADISTERRWMEVELVGGEEEVEETIIWLTGKGIRVDPSPGDSCTGL